MRVLDLGHNLFSRSGSRVLNLCLAPPSASSNIDVLVVVPPPGSAAAPPRPAGAAAVPQLTLPRGSWAAASPAPAAPRRRSTARRTPDTRRSSRARCPARARFCRNEGQVRISGMVATFGSACDGGEWIVSIAPADSSLSRRLGQVAVAVVGGLLTRQHLFLREALLPVRPRLLVGVEAQPVDDVFR